MTFILKGWASLRSLLFSGLLIILPACGGTPVSPSSPVRRTPETATAPATALVITGPEVVHTGSNVIYKATATLSNGVTIYNATGTWDTDNPGVATIDSNGALTAQRPGAATITATFRGMSATATVQVQSTTAARAHLEDLLEIMQMYFVRRSTIAWSSLRTEVFRAAADARTVPETYPAIRLALQRLNDRESFYTQSDRETIGGAPDTCGAVPASVSRLPSTVGYVRVEGCNCQTSAAITAFAEALHRTIATADRFGVIGWIVDLRGNRGGNMWAMLAGVGPILGEGIAGYLMYVDREYGREYRAGAALSVGEVFAQVAAPYTLRNPYPKVAVLTDGSVSSAGESIVAFFRGRAGARSFGMPTCGHHHLQEDFPLSEAAVLHLTTAEVADRTRTTYEGPINPDEFIADPGQAIDRASAWLQAWN